VTQTVRLLRVASVILFIVVTLIVRDLSFIFLIALFLVGLLPKKDLGLRRAIRRVSVKALWAYSAHVLMVLCARWQKQQGVRCRRCRDQLAEDESLVNTAGEATMSSRTIFLSRLIGLYCIVIALSMMTRRQATVETVTALLQNPSMMLIVGIITLAAGLAVVLAHNIWSGGALVVVVTLVGWITLIKSLFLLFLPPEMRAGLFLGQLHYQQLFYLYASISLVLGVYLTYGGFKSRSS
jgi:hypothetical protein